MRDDRQRPDGVTVLLWMFGAGVAAATALNAAAFWLFMGMGR